MAIIIPDFTAYTNQELLSIADVQFRNYIESSDELAVISTNPAHPAVDNFFATLGTNKFIYEIQQNAEAAKNASSVVDIQTEGLQDKFDYAEAFALEWFRRFQPLTGFVSVKFEDLRTIDYDPGTDTISIN